MSETTGYLNLLKSTHQERVDRRNAIIEMRDNGMTYQEIGDIVGLTRERVRQIIKRKIYAPSVLLSLGTTEKRAT